MNTEGYTWTVLSEDVLAYNKQVKELNSTWKVNEPDTLRWITSMIWFCKLTTTITDEKVQLWRLSEDGSIVRVTKKAMQNVGFMMKKIVMEILSKEVPSITSKILDLLI